MPPYISQILQQHPDAGYWHQQYPWFSIGQLVHTANTKDTPAFTESAQRTAIFFNNIPWLHWLLHQPEVDVEAIIALLYAQKEVANKQPEQNAAMPEAGSSSNNILLYEKEIGKEIEPETELHNKTDIDVLAKEELKVPDTGEIKTEEVVDSFTSPIIEEAPTEAAASKKAEQAVLPEELVQIEPDDNIATEAKPQTAELTLEVSAIEEENQEEPEVENEEFISLPTSMLSESLAQAADSFKNAPVDEELVFKTAYQHTIDYFASQGIKLDVEPAKDDRFGQQLKTFTSWLRHMKRLPDATVPEADPLVESQAAHSLQRGEVVTEPMVDVLIKQGKNAQAVAVLEKLRLLHPQKSHYFAARIDQIKHS